MKQSTKEIDLIPYLVAIKSYWWLVVLSALVCIGLGLFRASLQPPAFKATTILAVTQANTSASLDNVGNGNSGQEPLGVIYNALPQLAVSDAIVTRLLSETTYFADAESPVSAMRGALEATPVMNPSLLSLTVTLSDRSEAARLANVWATIFTEEANQLYDGHGDEQVAQYKRQLVQIDSELLAAQSALADFEALNEATVIENQLNAKVAQHAELLIYQQTLQRLSRETEAYSSQLQLRDPQEIVSLSDQLTLYSLQSNLFGISNEIPLQINIDNSQLADEITVREQINTLSALSSSASRLIENIGLDIEQLVPEITTLQGQFQIISNEADILLRRIAITTEAQTALARKFEEARIAEQAVNRPIQIASGATTPEFSISPQRTLTTLVFGIVGTCIGLFLILATCWLRQTQQLVSQASNNQVANRTTQSMS